MEDPAAESSAGILSTGKPEDAPTSRPEEKPARKSRDNPAEEDQTGIIPGSIPGRPSDPADPRFPGSQPDLA
jgi:hypothetical protein